MLQEHIKHISPSRLSTYLDHFYSSDQSKIAEAVALYTAIQHRSGIFFSLIQEIEVATRNAMADCLRQCAPDQNLHAYFTFLATDNKSPLNSKAKHLLKNSMTKTNTKNENDVIANLTFGFWINLLNIQDATIKTAFRQLFPQQFSNFKDMYFKLKQVHTFRNDLFHQDKAWNRKQVKKPEHILSNYEKTYRNFEELLKKIAPERLQLRQMATLNQHFAELNFDLTLFASELDYLTFELFLEQLSKLYQEKTKITSEIDKDINMIFLEAFHSNLIPLSIVEIQSLLDCKPYIVDRIKENAKEIDFFSQPIVLLLYWLIEAFGADEVYQKWPLPEYSKNLKLMCTDLDKQPSCEHY